MQYWKRSDMAGAAVALAAATVVAGCNEGPALRFLLPLAENMPGPGAARPGDVVRAYNGSTVQILNTDFEGRLLLADALAFGAVDEPSAMIDIATLTHQAVVALGPEIGAVLGRDSVFARWVLAAAERAGEEMWQLPWATRYESQIRSGYESQIRVAA